MLKCLKIKDRNETIYFYSDCTPGVDCHYENEVSSGENSEDREEDLAHEPKLDSDSENEESDTDNDKEDDSRAYFQEVLDDSESDSDEEKDDKTFVDMLDLKVKKRRETTLEDSDSKSESEEESDTE